MAGQARGVRASLIEEADAWFEYLRPTRGQAELRYGQIEPWAWARLSQRLRVDQDQAHEAASAAA